MKKLITIILIAVFVPTYAFPYDGCIPPFEGINVKEMNENYLEFTYSNLNFKCNYEIGKIVAIVTPPASLKKIDPHEFLDCLHGTVTYAPDWDQP